MTDTVFKATTKPTAGCQLWAEKAVVGIEICAGYAKALSWVLDEHSTPCIMFSREMSPAWSVKLRRHYWTSSVHSA